MQAAKVPQAGSVPAGGGTSSGIYEAGRVGGDEGDRVPKRTALGGRERERDQRESHLLLPRVLLLNTTQHTPLCKSMLWLWVKTQSCILRRVEGCPST